MLQGNTMTYEKTNTGRKAKFPKSQMNLAVLLCFYYRRVEMFQKSEYPQGWCHFLDHDYSQDQTWPRGDFP
jgi:hypothetical protein